MVTGVRQRSAVPIVAARTELPVAAIVQPDFDRPAPHRMRWISGARASRAAPEA